MIVQNNVRKSPPTGNSHRSAAWPCCLLEPEPALLIAGEVDLISLPIEVNTHLRNETLRRLPEHVISATPRWLKSPKWPPWSYGSPVAPKLASWLLAFVVYNLSQGSCIDVHIQLQKSWEIPNACLLPESSDFVRNRPCRGHNEAWESSELENEGCCCSPTLLVFMKMKGI